MNKILFTHSYFYRFDPKSLRMKQPYPPLGTILAAAVIRQAGYPVALFDTNLRDSPSEIIPVIIEYAPRYLVFYDDCFNYLTKMCLTNMRDAAFEMIKIGKTHGCIVIISSSDSTDHYQKYLDQGADYVIRGEAEASLLEIINNLENQNTDLHDIDGVYYREAGHLFHPRPLISDLDSLPIPAWDLIDMQSYRSIWISGKRQFTLNIATTRGCQYRCNWCAKPIYGYTYKSRSPEKVIEEISFLMNNYNVREFWMCDDIFGQKPNWLNEFNALANKKELRFGYVIQTRADLLQDEKTVEWLAESGCKKVWMGAESGSQKILDAMNKGVKVEQIGIAHQLLKQHGIKTALFIQLGYLNETKEDIDLTIKMILDLMPDEIGISVSYPLPGTPYYEKVKNDLKEKSNWTDSNDLDLMFINNYSSEFYRQLYNYIHHRFNFKKSVSTFKDSVRNLRLFNPGFIKCCAKIVIIAALCITDKIKLNKLDKKPLNAGSI